MSKRKLSAAWYWIARFLCQVFTLLLFRYRVRGRENVPADGAFIIAANHQSFLDPVFCGIGATRALTYMARDSLFRSRVFGGLIRSVSAIPLSRDKADIRAMKLVITRLKEGRGVCLFPEGTRTRDGRIAAFKPGFGLLCRRSQSPVVPTLVEGAFECWPRHRKLFSPGAITVWFGNPISPEQVRSMTNKQLADHLTQTLRRMQHACRRRRGKQPYNYAD